MQYLPLLGKHLKDDDIVDVLEWADAEVIYDFDRTHENMPDKYWATAKSHGFRLGFDADQALEVIFLHATALEGFSPIDRVACDIPFFSSISEVESHGTKQRVRTVKGASDFLGVKRDWVRLEYDRHTLHYEFRDGLLALVTISKSR
jgi:hypothetical protein